MSIEETTIHLKENTNSIEFENYVNQISGVQRAMIDLENMNAVIQYDNSYLSEEVLYAKANRFM